MNAPECKEQPCYNDGCIVFNERSILCAEHARSALGLRKPLALMGVRPLIRPNIDFCVILRDKDPIAKGRIIIPEIAKDRFGRIKGEDKFATGLVLAVGPGYQARKRVAGAYLHDRQRVNAKPGMRVAFRAKYEQAITMWRGLALVHDFDVLTEFVEEAA